MEALYNSRSNISIVAMQTEKLASAKLIDWNSYTQNKYYGGA